MTELIMCLLTMGGLAMAMVLGTFAGLLLIVGVLLLVDAVLGTKIGRRIVRKAINYFYQED